MPVSVHRIGGKWRITEVGDDGAINLATNKRGTAVDGGGHDDRGKASRQAGYINAAIAKREKENRA